MTDFTSETFERLRQMAIDLQNAMADRVGSREEKKHVDIERELADKDIDELEQLWRDDENRALEGRLERPE